MKMNYDTLVNEQGYTYFGSLGDYDLYIKLDNIEDNYYYKAYILWHENVKSYGQEKLINNVELDLIKIAMTEIDKTDNNDEREMHVSLINDLLGI